MAMTPSSLWTPNGEVSIAKGQVAVTRPEVITLSKFHEFAGKHGLSLVCKRCDHAVTGSNTGQEAVLSLACNCREFIFRA